MPRFAQRRRAGLERLSDITPPCLRNSLRTISTWSKTGLVPVDFGAPSLGLYSCLTCAMLLTVMSFFPHGPALAWGRLFLLTARRLDRVEARGLDRIEPVLRYERRERPQVAGELAQRVRLTEAGERVRPGHRRRPRPPWWMPRARRARRAGFPA